MNSEIIAVKEFKESKDELEKIEIYCTYYELISGLMELSFRQVIMICFVETVFSTVFIVYIFYFVF